jgi:integrase
VVPGRRKKDSPLPRRVYAKHGALWFVDRSNKWHRLGPATMTLPAVLRAVAPFHDGGDDGLMSGLLSRYKREVLPSKAPKTVRDQLLELDRLGKVFGHMRPLDVEPSDCWGYYTARGSGSAAHHEVRLLSNVFTWARRWGVVTINPARGLGLKTPKPRTRYITDAEFLVVRELAPVMIGYAMDLALLTGLRQGDILSLERRHLTDQGIDIQTSKTGRKLVIEWNEELRATTNAILREQPQFRRALICRRDGKAMTSSGFQTLWQRLMAAATKKPEDGEPLLAERFTFHDLRAKNLSDEPTLQGAADRAGHADPRITQRVYRRLPQLVKALGILDMSKISGGSGPGGSG